MKVQITIELDVPTDGYSEEDIKAGMLEQNVWDETLKFATDKHQEEVLFWTTCKDQTNSVDPKIFRTGANQAASQHREWAKILKESVWKFKIL